MQKLVLTILASAAAAEEMFLGQKPSLEKDLINTSLDFDINVDKIVACQYFTESSVFSFSNILKPAQALDRKVTKQLETFAFSPQYTANWNYCEAPFSSSLNGCPDEANAFIEYKESETAGPICSALNPEKDANVGDTAGYELKDADNNVNGISLIYQGGKCHANADEQYTLNVTTMCPADKGADNQEMPTPTDHFTNGPCSYTVVYESHSGCPIFSLSMLTRFFNKYFYLFGAALILMGGFLSFFGNKFVNVVIFLVGSVALMLFGSALFINLALKKVDKEWVVWTAFIVILLISLCLGYLLVKFRKYGVGLFAAWGGVMLGFLVTTTFHVANVYAFYAIIIAGGIGMFIVAIYVEKTVIILLTAFIGSYAFVRGISLYAGGFPSETEFHAELEAGILDWENMPKSYYAYLAGILILFVVSSIY